MNPRQRQREDTPQTPASQTTTPSGGIGDQARRLLSAGDDAITRALSSDSRKFLDANRQTGGQ